jgi:hypothetical protein
VVNDHPARVLERDMNARPPKLSPQPAWLGPEGLVYGWRSEPNTRQLFVAEISQYHLETFGKFDYFRGKSPLWDAESLWIDGMQKWVSNTVWLVVDDSEGIYLFSTAQGSAKFIFLLGKLREDCELYPIAEKAFRDFIKGATNG